MSGFSGKFHYSLDPKGRVIIPAQFREIITANYGPKLYLTSSAFEKCLHIYPLEEWNKLQEKVKSLPKMNEAVRFYMRRVIASAVETTLDKQGRVLVPAAHREDSGINGEVVIVGQIDRLEIWDRAQWDEATDPARVDVRALEAALSGFGL
ncbi:MAG: division/cell wall cluster transcriptional repressor MraZ [Thermodesulfovibrionales bacterium]